MGLLGMLKKDESVRKIFGKRELKIIEKQLNGVPLTQSEKNRLSRDIRQKFRIISHLSRFESEFNLKKGSVINRVIDESLDVLMSDQHSRKIKQIWLYGSTAENSRTLRSDIDIAVSVGELSLREATSFRKRVQGKVDAQVDIQVFETLPKKIQKEIISSGKCLFHR